MLCTFICRGLSWNVGLDYIGSPACVARTRFITDNFDFTVKHVAFHSPLCFRLHTILVDDECRDGFYSCSVGKRLILVYVELVNGSSVTEKLLDLVYHRHHLLAMGTPACVKFNYNNGLLFYKLFVIHSIIILNS